MQIYYDVTIKDETKNNVSVSYWADSFSVDKNRILRVYSEECGNVVVTIGANERLFVKDVLVKDEWDDMEIPVD